MRQGTIAIVCLFGTAALACGGTTRKGDEPSGSAGPSATNNGGAEDDPADVCVSYCDDVMAACRGEQAVYTELESCLAICERLEPGDALEPAGNTLACRALNAKLAQREPREYCSAAGPGGADTCGSDCEAYCDLTAKICPENTEVDCLQACRGLTDQRDYQVLRDHGGDTLECRLVHLAAAARLPTEHCRHAPIPASPPWCVSED
jgi:hypothetical protein